MKDPFAACVLIFNEKFEILTCSRRNQPTTFGFPGGKLDPNETPIQAALRELEEETGIGHLNENDFVELYRGEDEDGNVAVTFLCLVPIYSNVPQLETYLDPEIIVKWNDWLSLLNGAYPEYNKRVLREFSRIGMLGIAHLDTDILDSHLYKFL